MPDGRLNKQIYLYDKREMQHGGCSENLRNICESVNELERFERNECINVKDAKTKLLEMYKIA